MLFLFLRTLFSHQSIEGMFIMTRGITLDPAFQAFAIQTFIGRLNFTHIDLQNKSLNFFRFCSIDLCCLLTSQRVIITRINCLSLVPIPAILLCNREAKYSALLQTQRHMAMRPSIMSPENSFLIAFSREWPVIFSYSWKIWKRIQLKWLIVFIIRIQIHFY